MSTSTKWETTREQNLLRNKSSGRYYARFTVANKQKWINLKTDVWTTAKSRLGDHKKRIDAGRSRLANVAAGSADMGALLAIQRARIADRVDITQGSKDGLLRPFGVVVKTWAGFEQLTPDRVTFDAVQTWRNRVRRDGTGFVAKGASRQAHSLAQAAKVLVAV